MSEKIFILGASGDIGSQLTRFLLKKNADVTLYARDVEKTKALFSEASDLRIVQGDYTTTDVFEKAIVGHTRLFVLVNAAPHMGHVKGTFAKIAYAAGVRQIVDISSFTVNQPYMSGFISSIHREGEENIRKAKGNDQFYVALRPGTFYTFHLWFAASEIKANQTFSGIGDLDEKLALISTADIAELASVVLTEPVEKHAKSVYTMASDTLSLNERAAIFSELLDKKITAKSMTAQEQYSQAISYGIPHAMAYDFISLQSDGKLATAYEVILGRPAQTFKQWLQSGDVISRFQ